MTNSIRLFLACFLVMGLLVFSGCDGAHDTSDSSDSDGLSSVSFTVQWPDEDMDDNSGAAELFLTAAEIMSDDCISRGVSLVAVAVKSSSGTTLKSGTFACSAKQGTLSGITPQSGCTIVVSGKNSAGEVIYQGQKPGVTLVAGPNNAVTIQVERMTNDSPVAAITSPSNNSTYTSGQSITVTGTGTDAEDGTLLASAFVWTSSIDGQIKTGQKSFSLSTLSVGTHTISLTVTDGDGASGSDSISITIDQQFKRITFNALPDTGQTYSYTDTFGEDSDYSINPQSYTKLDDTGTALGDNAASWTMVKDNVTGLIWQKATASERNWDSAILYCENLTLGGYFDWRLPTVMELSTLVNAGVYSPSINEDFFSGTLASYYWSSTTDADSTDDAWYVYFDYGGVNASGKSYTSYVRAVRGGQ